MWHIWNFSPCWPNKWQSWNPNCSVVVYTWDLCSPVSHLSRVRCVIPQSWFYTCSCLIKGTAANPECSQSPAGKIVIIHGLIELEIYPSGGSGPVYTAGNQAELNNYLCSVLSPSQLGCTQIFLLGSSSWINVLLFACILVVPCSPYPSNSAVLTPKGKGIVGENWSPFPDDSEENFTAFTH